MKIKSLLPLGVQRKLADRRLKNANTKTGILLTEGKARKAEGKNKSMQRKRRKDG